MSSTDPTTAPVELQVLGRIRLRRGDEPLRGVLSQPKRLALLVYLVLRRPGGHLSRDELLGVFWPESTEKRARASLRQALRFLRGHLGDGVIVNRGDGEVRVEPGTVAADALDLVRALDAGDSRRAVELYGGELLPGFLPADSYGFDRWLQGERQRLRSAVVQAALELSDAAEDRGDLAEAADRVHWALERQPTDEAVARRLITLLARTGNRAAAVSAYEELEARLAADLDLEPSQETTSLIRSVRDHGVAPAQSGRGPAGLSPRRILVTGLENLTGDPSLDAVGRLAADMIAQGLATLTELEVVPPMATMGAAAPDGSGTTDAEGSTASDPAGLALARRTGAGTLVDGAYYREGDKLRFHVRITDVSQGRLRESPAPVTGPVDEPGDAIEALADRVMAVLAPALTNRAVHTREAARPPSMEAYAAYTDGLERFIRGDWRGALTYFRRSADLAPDYPLPRIVQAIALWNLEELPEARATALEAAEMPDTLGRFERAVLDNVLAWLDGDWAAAHRAARAQAELAPGSIPNFQVAEEARRLNRPREAREVLSRLDPETGELKGWIFYWIERTAAHHLLGDHARELELASRCRSLHPDEPVAALLEIRALAALGRADDVARLLDEALATPGARDPAPGALLREAAMELRAHGSPEPASPLLERAVDWHRERAAAAPTDRAKRDLARSLYHAGLLDEARELFLGLHERSDGGVQPVGHHHGQLQAHLDAGYLAVIAARQGAADEADRWVACLEDLDRPFLYGAQWFWLAAVAAVRDQPDRAVNGLRRAFADGLPHEMFIHLDPHLMRLRGHPSLDAMMRPRG